MGCLCWAWMTQPWTWIVETSGGFMMNHVFVLDVDQSHQRLLVVPIRVQGQIWPCRNISAGLWLAMRFIVYLVFLPSIGELYRCTDHKRVCGATNCWNMKPQLAFLIKYIIKMHGRGGGLEQPCFSYDYVYVLISVYKGKPRICHVWNHVSDNTDSKYRKWI